VIRDLTKGGSNVHDKRTKAELLAIMEANDQEALSTKIAFVEMQKNVVDLNVEIRRLNQRIESQQLKEQELLEHICDLQKTCSQLIQIMSDIDKGLLRSHPVLMSSTGLRDRDQE